MSNLTATTYQPKSNILDSTMNAKKDKYIDGHTLYRCPNDLDAWMFNFKGAEKIINVNLLKLQLLIREKITESNTKTLHNNAKDFFVSFSINEYILLIGREDAIDDNVFRRNLSVELRQATSILQHIVYNFRTGQHSVHFNFVNFVEKNGGMFRLRIAPELLLLITEYLTDNGEKRIGPGLITKFSKRIYKLNNANAIRVQFLLDTHFSMNSNISNGVHNCLGLKTIARYLLLPLTKDELLTSRNSTNYYREMVEPILKALALLKDNDLIDYYLYTDNKSKPLSVEELETLKSTPELLLECVKVYYTSVDLQGYVNEFRAKSVQN